MGLAPLKLTLLGPTADYRPATTTPLTFRFFERHSKVMSFHDNIFPCICEFLPRVNYNVGAFRRVWVGVGVCVSVFVCVCWSIGLILPVCG